MQESLPLAILDRMARSIEAVVPDLRLDSVLGDVRSAAEVFPDYEGDPSERVDPNRMFQEMGFDIWYRGESCGVNLWVSSDRRTERWAGFGESILQRSRTS